MNSIRNLSYTNLHSYLHTIIFADDTATQNVYYYNTA